MTNFQRQTKITNMFKKKRATPPEDYEEIEKEVEILQQKVQEKKFQLFQLKREFVHQRLPKPKEKPGAFVLPQKIQLSSMISNIEKSKELYSMLTGIEVQSYVKNDNCCVLYHLQHPSKYEVKHGLRINIKNDVNEIEKLSMPVGFNLNGVVEQFENVLKPECLLAIRSALVAYYDRLGQVQAMQNLLLTDAHVFQKLDGSYVEVKFAVQSTSGEDERVYVILMLDYDIYGVRPKSIGFVEKDLSEDVLEVLRNQSLAFKRKTLSRAFKEAFIKPLGEGRYKLVQQLLPRASQSQPKRVRPKDRNYNNQNDDTFLPEDCSEPSDDDDGH